jgi:hypothetical protein
MIVKDYEKERRRQARLERLGSNNPKCLFCDEDDPSCLEQHHISGKKFGDVCATVCRNHHRKLSDKQKEHPPTGPGIPTPLERLGRLLLGIADALELLNVPQQLLDPIRDVALRLIDMRSAGPTAQGQPS